ncbi:stealth conserved region 3 domain-containing protein [Phytobacter ursingii]|uniref:stealth conserved region 3 domain-containing protein n=1 Tax=Phytobacter ursingii TaxID=1972431 RepID=UPI000CD1F26A|nr:sugar phosphotransferase [Enterobacteriaceae bacterium ENNIH1]
MISRKLAKLFSNPNLFFYDLFKKRVFKNTADYKINDFESGVDSPSSLVNNKITCVDIFSIQKNGIYEYLHENLKCAFAPEDGIDSNSLLIWSGYLSGLLTLIGDMKKMLSLNITIYTMGGGFNHKSNVADSFDIRLLSSKLSKRPDFVVEMSNELGALYVLHFYLYDINAEGLVQVRSSKALIKKCHLNEVSAIFNKNRNPSVKIDAVYTWVNHADETWQKKWLETFPDDSFDPDRYTSNDELKYSLRSLNKYAPWLNHIYIVSNCSKPAWLKLGDKVTWVDHSEIFPETEMLPSFNSHAIECCLHKIPDLAESFIYLNDDFILAQPTLPGDFFDEAGRSISYFESYGMVYDKMNRDIIPDYLQAAINSNNLLKEKFNNYSARNLHRHVPYALKKSVLEEIERSFPEAIRLTRSAKCRSSGDINLTSFFYHHFAFVTGQSVRADLSGIIVRPENIKNLVARDSYKYKVLCFNDGNGSSGDENYKNLTMKFFDERLAEKAGWEIN